MIDSSGRESQSRKPKAQSLRSARLLPLFITFIAAFLSPACRQQAAAPPAREILVWRPVGNYSGRATVQTSSFTSDTGSLRFRWEARDKSPNGSGTFRVTVHSAISGRPLDEVVNHHGSGRDTSYLYEDPRVFYLVVDASNVEWSVGVDEGIPATVEPNNR
jgi:hypothetical protein